MEIENRRTKKALVTFASISLISIGLYFYQALPMS